MTIWGGNIETVFVDQLGATRMVVENEEEESAEDIARETRELATDIHLSINPPESTSVRPSVGTLPLLSPPASRQARVPATDGDSRLATTRKSANPSPMSCLARSFPRVYASSRKPAAVMPMRNLLS